MPKFWQQTYFGTYQKRNLVDSFGRKEMVDKTLNPLDRKDIKELCQGERENVNLTDKIKPPADIIF